jgi:hypothetical protein
MNLAKDAAEVMCAALAAIDADPEGANEATSALGSQTLVAAAINCEDRFAFCFSLGIVLGQLLAQFPPECGRALAAGMRAGRALTRLVQKVDAN